MSGFTTPVLERLRQIENLIKAMETEDIELELFPRLTEPPVCNGGALVGVASCCAVSFKRKDIIYKNILSLLRTEQYKLKQELKDSLDIGENTHWEED